MVPFILGLSEGTFPVGLVCEMRVAFLHFWGKGVFFKLSNLVFITKKKIISIIFKNLGANFQGNSLTERRVNI